MRTNVEKRQPQGTPFGWKLGVEGIGSFYPLSCEAEFSVTPTQEDINNLGTVHGGFIMAVFDEVAARLTYVLHGLNSAVTERSSITLRLAARPRQRLTFSVRLEREDRDRLWLSGVCRSNTRDIATLESVWLRRDTRARSS